MPKQETNNSETIKMVERALEVLDLLKNSKSRLGVNEIAKKCGLNPSTAFRILKTLEKSGWIFQLSDDRYIAGQKISFVTEKNNLMIALQDVSGYIMKQHTERRGQAMNLMVREGTSCIIIQQSRTDSFVDYVPPLYSRLPIYACAGGKVFLSELPISLTGQILKSCDLKPLTPYTLTDPEEIWRELRSISDRGYAFDNRESAENGCCIAVPVRDLEGTVIAALSFSGFIGVKDTNDLLTYLPNLREAASSISKSLFSVYTGSENK